MDLQKVEQLESKINTELEKLKGHIAQMETELETYNDLDTLKETAEEKKRVSQGVYMWIWVGKGSFVHIVWLCMMGM